MRPTPRGIISVQCLAGLTLALFFYTVPQTEGRRLAIERLRWLELARPHRSLDALLVIIAEQARHLTCDEVVIAGGAVTEQSARSALAERAETAGFVGDRGRLAPSALARLQNRSLDGRSAIDSDRAPHISSRQIKFRC